MRKIYIVSGYALPRSCAAANYIQYLASALVECGYELHICAPKNKMEAYKPDSVFCHKNVTMHDYICADIDSFIWRIQNRLNLNNENKPLFLKKTKFTSDDVIIIYNVNFSQLLQMIRLRNKYSCKIICCPTEHFELNNMSGKHIVYKYLKYAFAYRYLVPRMDLNLSISRKIDQLISMHGGKSFVLPIMADVSEQCPDKMVDSTYKLIYPNNGNFREAVINVFRALCKLDQASLNKIEFHVNNVDKEAIRCELGSENFEKIQQRVVFHPWMAYDELIALYRKMHFLLLVREDIHRNHYNFPSKVPETMTCGIVPIINDLSDDCVQLYLQDDNNSIILRDNTEESCLRAISKVASMDAGSYEALSRAARRTAETRFDYHNWVGVLLKEIESLFA